MKNDIYKKLKEEIITCKYYPGESIEEKALTEKYNVSRTPIREILTRLKEDNWVESSSGKGLQVSQITLKQIKDLFQLRYELEPLMLKFSYNSIPIENLMAIREKMKKAIEDGDVEKLTELDDRLHYEILINCKNDLAISIMNNVQERTRRFRYLTHSVKEETIKSGKEHLLLIDAICERDLEKSTRILKLHIDSNQLYIMRNINL